ncbi:MAG: HAD family phosphatase, partial [Bacteroidota bacterium]
MPNTIVFDLGGVLIDWNPRYVYRSKFATEAEMEDFLTNITTHDWNEQQDAGRPIAEATELLVAQHPEWEEMIRAFYGEWETMLGGPIQEMVDILREIRDQGKHRIYALTNWSAETFPIALARYDFLHWFEGTVVSGVEMCKKPDEKIYRILLDRYQLKGEDCLFIDDSLRNVKGSIAAGLPA